MGKGRDGICTRLLRKGGVCYKEGACTRYVWKGKGGAYNVALRGKRERMCTRYARKEKRGCTYRTEVSENLHPNRNCPVLQAIPNHHSNAQHVTTCHMIPKSLF